MAGWDIIVLSIVMVFSHHCITGCLRDTVQTSLSISGTIYVPLSTGCLVLVIAVSACSLCFSSFSLTFLVILVSVFLGLFSLRRFMKEPPAPHVGRDVFKSSFRSEWHDGYGAMSPLRACCCNGHLSPVIPCPWVSQEKCLHEWTSPLTEAGGAFTDAPKLADLESLGLAALPLLRRQDQAHG